MVIKQKLNSGTLHNPFNLYDMVCITVLPFICYSALQFAHLFPHILWSKAKLYYISAQWKYDNINTLFDNSIGTWGTDYFLAVVMGYGAWKCFLCRKSRYTDGLRYTSSILFFLYFLSVLSGGIAHQHFKVNELDTVLFRVLWYICVVTVAMAGGAMGAVGSKLCKALTDMGVESYFHVFIVPDVFWYGWSAILAYFCAIGELSYHRPACDIFIAGTTQILPTCYCILAIISRKWDQEKKKDMELQLFLKDITPLHRALFCVSWLLNCPLLPAYPLLLHQELPEGLINSMLHFNLFCAWGLQCYTVHRFSLAFANAEKRSLTRKK